MAAQRKICNLQFYIFIVILLSCSYIANAQSNYLYRKISVSFHDITLKKALDEIATEGGFTFSYNSKNFNEQELVSLQAENKTVLRCLNSIFDNTVRYKVVGSHVILMKKNIPEFVHEDNKPNEYIITGYIIDSRTGEKIREATIYEVNGRVVSLSNTEGFYSINVPSDINMYGLSYSKSGYLDTVIMVEPANKSNLNITLNPRYESINKLQTKDVNLKLEDLHKRELVDILVPEESKIISDNLVIHESRKIQVSLIPYIGTNRKLSGSVDNNLSLNLLAGYSGGVNGFELGGLLNIVRRDVKGSQVAGVINFVGGNTGPFQMAGCFNVNGGSVKGTQIAGFSNVVLDTLTGVQLAGFNNTLHGYMNGVQLSGFNNVTTQNVDGFQLTGFANVALKDVKLGQISGFANYCDNVDGGQVTGFVNFAKGDVNWGQIAGFANYGKSVKGFQIAGFGNISVNEVTGGQISGGINYGKTGGKFQLSAYANVATEEMDGIQLTAFANYAKKVNGYQIAILNISDTIESGLPIGLFSFSKKGFHRIEISANESFYLNTAYKLGVYKLYNSIRFGYNFSDLGYAGYGLGTQFKLGKKFNFNIDLSSDVLFDINSFDFAGTLTKLTPTFDYNFTKHVALYLGPVFNISTIEKDSSTNTFKNIAPYSFYSETYTNTQVKMWVGGIIGLSVTL